MADKDAVLMAAAHLLVREPAASMAEVASAAGISRATLHRLVDGRKALVRELAELGMRRGREAVRAADLASGDPREAYQRLVDGLVPIADLFNLLYREQTADEMYAQAAELDDAITALFQRGQRTGAFRTDMTAAWMTEAFYSLLGGAAMAAQQGRLASRDVGLMTTQTLLAGITTKEETA
ncbi:TetR/AcrR family transcriptional regulator [Fodinicola acaciae]|uniref:TetR/AcrR family transcriptional regulator n=1 Tax=Fodinicola acaciae TaxID=2681555 RepID=UPI001C9E5133|nr:TetR family transcriptional regulator [Fodinicola acaciae]